MDDNTKLVDFALYCPMCKHNGKKESEEPCDECLEVPARRNSHKPERWEGKHER